MLNCRAVGLKWWVSGDSFSWWFFSYLQKICSWFGLLRLADWPVFCILSSSPHHLYNAIRYAWSQSSRAKYAGCAASTRYWISLLFQPCGRTDTELRLENSHLKTRLGPFFSTLSWWVLLRLIFLANAAAVRVVTCIQLSMLVGKTVVRYLF